MYYVHAYYQLSILHVLVPYLVSYQNEGNPPLIPDKVLCFYFIMNNEC